MAVAAGMLMLFTLHYLWLPVLVRTVLKRRIFRAWRQLCDGSKLSLGGRVHKAFLHLLRPS